jgi:hypothetical protein
VVTILAWETTYRISPSRYPSVSIFDTIADPADLEITILLEAATNPRVLDEAGELTLVRPEERISGPDTTAIMAAFTHTKPNRFTDGSFGVYYAAGDENTAITETAYHRSRFLRDARLPNERLDMRVYTASISGAYDDVRPLPTSDPLYNPDPYAHSQTYAAALHAQNKADGIVFRSVRNPAGECVAAFRPRCVTRCTILKHLEYRFKDYRLDAAVEIKIL